MNNKNCTDHLFIYYFFNGGLSYENLGSRSKLGSEN